MCVPFLVISCFVLLAEKRLFVLDKDTGTRWFFMVGNLNYYYLDISLYLNDYVWLHRLSIDIFMVIYQEFLL